jgi:hypothetical protein
MKKKTLHGFKVNWRDTWYSVVIWLGAIIVGGFVILPWYYLVLPLVVFWTTTVYFHNSDKTLKAGLWVSLFWFFAVAALDVLEIFGPYYSNAALYFSDSRNWLKYPIILLTPVIYSLILENGLNKKSKRRRLGMRVNKHMQVSPHISPQV